MTLDIRSVTKTFGANRVLDGVDLHVREGEFVTLLGPSGSGKTTLLRIVVGFESPSAGVVLLRERDVAGLAPAERRVGMVFQQYALFPHMTVAANVEYGLRLRGWPRAERRRRMREMLEIVRLDGLEERYPSQLSGGQQQRVAFARALAFGPDLLLMDEPLGALDRTLRLEMEEEIRRVHRELGTTVVYVTHDQQEALALSDRIAVMEGGRIVGLDSPDGLYYQPPNTFVARFFANANLLPATVRGALDGRAPVEVAGQRLTVPVAAGVEAGEPVALSVRPGSLRLQDGGDAGLWLEGEVREVLMLGEGRELSLALPDGRRIQAVLDARLCAGVQVGASVRLFAPADEAVLVRVHAGAEPAEVQAAA